MASMLQKIKAQLQGFWIDLQLGRPVQQSYVFGLCCFLVVFLVIINAHYTDLCHQIDAYNVSVEAIKDTYIDRWFDNMLVNDELKKEIKQITKNLKEIQKHQETTSGIIIPLLCLTIAVGFILADSLSRRI